jgi:phosphohistidine swiveling domain-containing protein
MPTNNQNHHLHYRGEFSLLSISFLLSNTKFLDVDYIHLYSPENRCFSAYLTKNGLAQMRQLGLDHLHNNPNWHEIFTDAKKRFSMVDALQGQNVPHVSNPAFYPFWETILDHRHAIADSYIFCDQPTVAALEELAHQPHIYTQLEQIGHHKLEAHKRLSILENILHEVIRQCGKAYSIAIHDLEMLTLEEFSHFLKKGGAVVPKGVRRRKKGYVWRKKQGRWVVETGSAHHKWTARLLPSEDVQSVSGMVTFAVPEPVTGGVKLHLSFSGTTNIKKGDVLVTGMTNPQLVPMLKNAAAIVTDEGGIMCHAAIISRELKIPCIVGTKDATQIFKNRDTIQVDTQTKTATKLT